MSGKKKIVAEYRRRKAHNRNADQSAIALQGKDAFRSEKIPN